LTIAGHDGSVDLRTTSYYTRQLRSALPVDAFHPVPSRLAWLALHVTLAASAMVCIARGWGGVPAAALLALIIGHSFAGMAFVGHELLHGAVVRAPRLRQLVGWLCFLPFTLSPRLWVAWHNRVHHGHTGEVGVDPDAYPTLAQYHASRLLRVADRFSLGGRRWMGAVMLTIGFSVQSGQILWRFAARLGLSRREVALARAETLAGVAVWAALAVAVGAHAFVFAFVVPLAVGNAIVMAYILTNHSLSPLTDVNDPLCNSLSVTAPRLFERLHLDFGLHVEHHLFPAMSSRHARRVRELIVARWPGRYQSMPLGRALALLFATPRVYKEPTRLFDPRTGDEHPTLLPDEESAVDTRAA
jgi:fatty acid desaturase